MNPLIDTALRYLEQGLSVIPQDAEKHPLVKWTSYQRERMNDVEARMVFDRPQVATIGLVAGTVSDGLLVFDFDNVAFYDRWRATVSDLLRPQPPVVARSGGGGIHLYLRCDDPGRSRGLAFEPDPTAPGGRKVAIEVKATGGLATVPPSVSTSGPYTFLEGSFEEIPRYDMSTVAQLIQAASDLNEVPLPTRHQIAKGTGRAGATPEIIARWNDAHPVRDILVEHGYVYAESHDNIDRYIRPGGEHPSVSVLDGGHARFFNLNDPLWTDEGEAHDAFSLYTELEHDGDLFAALAAAERELSMTEEEQPDTAATPASPQRALLHARDLGTLPPPRFLYQDMLLEQSVAVFYGQSSLGKTFFALRMAYELSLDNIPSVYIAGEGAGGLHQRVAALEALLGAPPGPLYFYAQPVNLMDAGEVAAFIELASPVSPRLIVIDTLHTSMIGGDDSQSRDVGLALHGARAMRDTFGAAILILHHTTKEGINPRGSGSIVNDADTIGFFTEDETLVLRCEKQRDAPDWTPKQYRLSPAAGSLVAEFVTPEAEVRLGKKHQQILEVLQRSRVFRETGAKVVELSEMLDHKIPRSTLYRLIDQLDEAGLIEERTKNGDPIKITGRGQGWLAGLYRTAQPIAEHQGPPEAQTPAPTTERSTRHPSIGQPTPVLARFANLRGTPAVVKAEPSGQPVPYSLVKDIGELVRARRFTDAEAFIRRYPQYDWTPVRKRIEVRRLEDQS